MNSVVLVGRLTKDPESRLLEKYDRTVTTFTLAVERPCKNPHGEREADFIPVELWGKRAETAAKYLSKGKMVSVSGRLEITKYKNGEGKTVYYTRVVGNDFQFLSPKSSDESIG